jgi:hypothetical protein
MAHPRIDPKHRVDGRVPRWARRSLCESQAVSRHVASGKDLAAYILKHVVTDSLVKWAWAPGPGRTPAPGTNAEFGALLEA